MIQHRKKARLSDNPNSSKLRNVRNASPSTSSSGEDEEDDDEELHDDEETLDAPPSTQYELLRDAGFKHLQNPDLDDQRANQKFLARNQQIGDNHAAHNAIIEEITCMNFMCHDRLHVSLGPLINFIVGMNGSGKSAVLTAITLCLGGKAASTNRGASLKSLIKGGRDQAVLVVKLKNQGNDAYQPDVFGKSIIIERHFSRAGSSGFRLKNENGRLISSKKGDVEDIVEYYQLQVDNPMNVLTQDAAKSFITSSTPVQKYKFFVEGVQLQALDNDYKLVSDTCDQIQAKLDESKDDIRALEKTSEAAKAKSVMAMQHEGMRKQAKRLSMQAAWAQVEEQEAILAKKEQLIADAQEKIDEAESTTATKDQTFQKAEEALERAKEIGNRLEEEISPLKDQEEAAKSAYDAATSDVQRAHTDQKAIGKSLAAVKNKVKRFEEDIEEELKRMEDANGGAHSQKLTEIQEAEKAVSDAGTALEQHNGDIARLEEARQRAKDNVARMKIPLAAKRNDVETARERLSGLNLNRGNVMAGFDNRMPKVLQLIRNDGGFLERPIGPLGMHIKLLNPSWSNVLESTMSGALTSFIVTNKPDQMRLSSMFDICLTFCS
jgi:chromosome segregation ATPase